MEILNAVLWGFVLLDLKVLEAIYAFDLSSCRIRETALGGEF